MRTVFMGTPEFAVPVLAALPGVVAVYTKEPKPSGRGRSLVPSPVAVHAASRGIPVFTPESFRKDPDAVSTLASINPDLIVVFAYGLMLPQQVLDMAPCVCVHPSLLPLYRGPNPIRRAVMNGDERTGVSLILMDAGMDSGDILAQRATDIMQDETAGELAFRLAEIGCEMVLEYIARPSKPAKQQGDFTLAPKFGPDEEQIDLSRPAKEVHDKIRAMNPEPGARLGNGVKILRSELADTDDGKGLILKCNPGFVRVLELQKPGGRPVSARDFLNGRGRLA
ncbi:MAG: methionyl-tRNA formyltransferase [Rickettsiales bacterium]|jgi:methionyl-tRNA formyltransferase|nr:methionyl-tRNA formyltransferase [Rickettsiales bacterium]